MEIIDDILSNQAKIQDSINRYGYSSEHNFWHFHYYADKTRKNYFFSFNKDNLQNLSILARKHLVSNKWYMFSDIVAPREIQFSLFKEFLDYVLKKDQAKSLSVEVRPDFREEILEKLKGSEYIVSPIDYKLTWPIINIKDFDVNISGAKFSNLRNKINLFKKNNSYEIVTADAVDKKKLLEVIKKWCEDRKKNDRTNNYYYANIVKNNFKGFDSTRIILVNNDPVAITAGWKIPNSDHYYSAVGIYVYIPGLGEFCNYDDILNIKKMGYNKADFGGSEETLLDFKSKFGIESTYDTVVFSIKLKK